MTTNDQDATVTDEINTVMERLRQHKREPEEVPNVSNADMLDKLKKAGYPQRHRENLSIMRGPALAKAKALLNRVMTKDALLLLYGERGPGKTQMATWWASQRVKAGKSAGIYVKCADIFQEIKQTWDANKGKDVGTENDVLRRYRETPFLVIDELHEMGSSVKSDWGQRTLINILDHRYDSRKITILIANFSEERLNDEVNPSIQSRAEETGGIVPCNWPSYRSQNMTKP